MTVYNNDYHLYYLMCATPGVTTITTQMLLVLLSLYGTDPNINILILRADAI